MINIKKKFNFRGSFGNLLYFKKYSNLFLVLLDRRERHVLTLTSGFCKSGRTRKQKVAPLNVIIMIKKLKTYLDSYNVKFVCLTIRQRMTYHFHNLKRLLKLFNIKIVNFVFTLKKPHSKKRGRKPKRI